MLICLLLGVISSIVLAWGCAALVNPDLATPKFDHQPRSDGSEDVLVVQSRFGHTRINRAVCSQLKLDDNGDILLARWSSTGDASSETQAGWPLRAFSCRNAAEVSIRTGNSSMSVMRSGFKPVEGGWEMSPFAGRGMVGGAWRGIPLRPMWSGLIVDVGVLAFAWYALIVGIGTRLRFLRRARGLCPWCGYDLRSGGLSGQRCPECGRA